MPGRSPSGGEIGGSTVSTSYARTLVVAVVSLAAAGVVLAAPAAAMGDPGRPTAAVTHGPSCGPGAVRVLVTNGTRPHRVALVFDDGREQDAADLRAGEQVELVSSDVAWGVTVDVSVAVTADDGTAELPLELSTYTRPSAEDCAAVAAPSSSTAPSGTPVVVPPATTVPEATPPTVDGPVPPGVGDPVGPPPSPSWSAEPVPPAPDSASPDGTTPGSTVPETGSPGAPETAAAGTVPPAGTPSAGPPARTGAPGSPAGRSSGRAASSSSAAVSPGGVVTVRATGFTAGEPVTVSIPGIDEPLTTVPAAADGSVQTVVQIPREVALGSTTVQFTGTSSAATAGLDLDVAARDRVAAESAGSPVTVAAGLALVGAAGTLGLMGARRSRGRHAHPRR